MPTALLIALPLAYLVGSVPFGFLLGRSRGIDLREHGSGNIGATNAMRVLGRRLGILCFVLDFLKGFGPALVYGLATGLAGSLSPEPAAAWGWMAVAGATMLGHIFPVWLGFKGGKGVATGFGAMAGVFPIITLPVLAALVLWLVSVRVTRYVGVSSCLAAAALVLLVTLVRPLAVAFGPEPAAVGGWPAFVPFIAVVSVLAALVIVRHRGNIARTLAGTEAKIGQGKGRVVAGRP